MKILAPTARLPHLQDAILTHTAPNPMALFFAPHSRPARAHGADGHGLRSVQGRDSHRAPAGRFSSGAASESSSVPARNARNVAESLTMRDKVLLLCANAGSCTQPQRHRPISRPRRALCGRRSAPEAAPKTGRVIQRIVQWTPGRPAHA